MTVRQFPPESPHRALAERAPRYGELRAPGRVRDDGAHDRPALLDRRRYGAVLVLVLVALDGAAVDAGRGGPRGPLDGAGGGHRLQPGGQALERLGRCRGGAEGRHRLPDGVCGQLAVPAVAVRGAGRADGSGLRVHQGRQVDARAQRAGGAGDPAHRGDRHPFGAPGPHVAATVRAGPGRYGLDALGAEGIGQQLGVGGGLFGRALRVAVQHDQRVAPPAPDGTCEVHGHRLFRLHLGYRHGVRVDVPPVAGRTGGGPHTGTRRQLTEEPRKSPGLR